MEFPETTLLIALRNDLGLRGVRSGCNTGHCGSCTVLVDGRAIRSCQTPLSDVAGTRVTTPEGLGTPGAPHRVQRVFLEEQAAQCGYCINGIEMTVAALLRDHPDVSSVVEAALSEHMCRCGTHVRVLRAIRRLALGEPHSPPEGTTWDRLSPMPAERASSDADHDDCGSPPGTTVSSLVEDRLRLLPDGRIEFRTGKVEIGQGIATALQQIAAAGIGVPPESIVMSEVTTGSSPDEGTTAASASIEVGGTALAAAAATFRRMLIERAAQRDTLRTPPQRLAIDHDRVIDQLGRTVATLAQLAEDAPLVGRVDESARWDRAPVGNSLPRLDLPSKTTGAPGFVHDLALPSMLHARVLLPPNHRARLEAIDLDAVAAMTGVSHVLRRGSIVVVIAEREEQAIRGVRAARGRARWTDPGIPTLVSPEFLRDLPALPFVARRDDGLDGALAGVTRVTATYSKPYQAHGPIAPSCAVALFEPAGLSVWTHSQGIHRLRSELIRLLDLDHPVTVRHAAGPGCYGFNCADDVAALAALAALEVPGFAIRLQFSVEDEFGWDPNGPAMLADLEASLDTRGAIAAWRHTVWTDAHNARPDGSGSRLMAAWLGTDGPAMPWGGPTESGARNIVPIYDLPVMDCVAHFVQGPLRSGELRSLGAFFNVFAAESFMDELAEAARADPVEFRLAHMSDPRARRVLEAAAEAVGWRRRVGPSGGGQGIATARYKGTKAYVAAAIDVEFDDVAGPRPRRVVLACDAGTVINPDGLRNQLEGGAIQGLSRTMVEAVTADATGILSRSWADYPIFRFTDTPDVRTVLLDRTGYPPLGAGEASIGPVAAAYANAVDDASGIRMRHLPITTDRLMQRLLDMSPEETERVILG